MAQPVAREETGALAGVRVVDFSTLLPGPLATLFLAECGAEVVKVERPGTGDEMRNRNPRLGPDSAGFALLNRGKRSVAVDLKLPDSLVRLRPLLASADVLVEQFRPGVMDRLGLGYDAVRAINPRLVYCSISGYGQVGPRAQKAGHDLNYVAESGLLSLAAESGGAPAMPAAAVADVAGGSYAALLNILLALHQRQRTGTGCHLDVAMADNVVPFMYGALARGFADGSWPAAGPDEWTGASPRYRCYRAQDGRYLAVAAVEDKFWQTFCAALGVAPDAADADAIARVVASRPAAEWERALAGKDACVSIVRTVQEAMALLATESPGMTGRQVASGKRRIPALPLPIAPALRGGGTEAGYPLLGADDALLGPQP